jgi:pimeloyl-ACP methyl ester carboxylesterase
MSTYVLIHGGSNRNGGDWAKVKQVLETHSHKVFCPALSAAKHSSLTSHILEVLSLIDTNNLKDIILVGHSYGGMVITEVASKIPEKINRLVYLDAVVPHKGQSLFDAAIVVGIDLKSYGVEPFKTFTEPAKFDEKIIKALPKTYIFATQSEFKKLTSKMFETAKQKAKEDHWNYFKINTTHLAMITQPNEVAKILFQQAYS